MSGETPEDPADEPRQHRDDPARSAGQPPTGYPPPDPYRLAPEPGGYPTGPYPAGPMAGGYPGAAGPSGPPEYLGLGYPAAAERGRPRRRRRRWPLIATAAATVAVLAGGGITAYTLLAGSGIALDSRVPASVTAYLEVNLDPPAGQKVGIVQFFRHFSNLHLNNGSGSLVDSLVEPLIANPTDRQKFVSQIKPWLGKHVAIAAYPHAGKTNPLVVVESTDPAKARAGLGTLTAGAPDIGYVIVGNTVVLSTTEATARAASDEARTSSLHGDANFAHDLASVGDGGVVTAWTDLAKVARSGGLSAHTGDTTVRTDALTANLHGRVALRLSFSDTTADLLVRATGLAGQGAAGDVVGPRLASLPDDTAFALGVSGADRLVLRAYRSADRAGLGSQLARLQQRLGLVLPDDLAALVGSTTVVAIGGPPHRTGFGVVSRTSDVGRAHAAAGRLLAALGADSTQLTVRSTADGTVLTNSPGYADKLTGAAGSATLGNRDAFRAALPDLGGSQFALYVDFQTVRTLGKNYRLPAGAVPVRAFGATATQQPDAATLRLRLIVG